MKLFTFCCFLSISIPAAALAEVRHYTIDPVHSNINFSVRHLQLSRVTGNFGAFQGEITYDAAQPANSRVEVTIQVASINTYYATRDAHLNTEDFFNTPTFPVATFVSTSWVKTRENQYDVTGNLTLLDKSLPVTLKVELVGEGQNQSGDKLSGWTATARIDRPEWGISYGLLSIDATVQLDINIQARQSTVQD